MKKYLNILKHNPLFANMTEEELPIMLDCLMVKVRDFSKNEIILMAGDRIDRVGIVVEGSVHIVKEDIMGNRTIIAHIATGQIFGEAFSCASTEKLPVTVMASVNCTIMFIDYNRIINTCSNACLFHHRLLENMLGILARKNIMLNNKIEHMSKRSTRDKVLSYLFEQTQQQERRSFKIPFNRQELADYLCVDRSALSNELSKLREEGILEFNKNEFNLLMDEFH
ncbi:Crp/Fnr family transcriptional regulator [Aminipila butyrica]|uniref:Crp/Fnr family transcriptional regulator n=1 Tax=Aminipila butyrica TaxID=433296 RepID=A0A858BVX0_9FIRM|nr:Crp/Fnr family transcriptional regulator [Aminipila butyrica]QIB69737.1 Crp/Fnr family transcriptional regulator [Aminipila butyrica]